MTSRAASVLLPFALTALGTIGCSPAGLGSRTCAPGTDVACACGASEGHQICRADGTGFGSCACDDGGAPRVDGGAELLPDGGRSEVDAWTAPALDAWVAPPPDAWIDPDTGPPP